MSLIFTRKEFTKFYGKHPDYVWKMLQENYKRMALSERIRPDCEAAPWVIQEVKKLEAENARLRAALEWIASDKPVHDAWTSKAQNEIARAALSERKK